MDYGDDAGSNRSITRKTDPIYETFILDPGGSCSDTDIGAICALIQDFGYGGQDYDFYRCGGIL
jgi:hypothetical protein